MPKAAAVIKHAHACLRLGRALEKRGIDASTLAALVMAGGGAVGAGVGAAANPGHRTLGAIRGASRTGAILPTGAAGALIGGSLDEGMGGNGYLGAGLGAAAGGLAGNALWDWSVGKTTGLPLRQAAGRRAAAKARSMPQEDTDQNQADAEAIREMDMDKVSAYGALRHSAGRCRYNRRRGKMKKKGNAQLTAAEIIQWAEKQATFFVGKPKPPKYKTIHGPSVRTNKGQFGFTGRTARHLLDDPAYSKYSRGDKPTS